MRATWYVCAVCAAAMLMGAACEEQRIIGALDSEGALDSGDDGVVDGRMDSADAPGGDTTPADTSNDTRPPDTSTCELGQGCCTADCACDPDQRHDLLRTGLSVRRLGAPLRLPPGRREPGVCKLHDAASGACWSDAECGLGEACLGAFVWACGFDCAVADELGACVGRGGDCCDPAETDTCPASRPDIARAAP